MRRPLRWLALFAAAGVAACSGEKSTDTPTSPDFKPDRTGCNFPTLQQAVNAQFDGSTDTYVSQLINDAKNLGVSAAADPLLYEALDTLSAQFEQGTAETASTMAYQTLLCTQGGGGNLADDSFVDAFGTTGAFAAVGYEEGDSRTVASHDGLWVLHPPRDIAGATWASISNKEPLIIYGAPVEIAEHVFTADPPILSTHIFDWQSHPTGVAFNPKVVVGNCEQGTGAITATYIQHNSISSPDAEILDFVTPDCADAVGASLRLGLSDRIWNFFAPATAHAAFFFPTSGGRKGALSPDAAVSVDALVFQFEAQPHKSANKVGQPLKGQDGNTLSVVASSDGGTSFKQTQVFGWLEAANNSGVNVQVCNNWAYSDEDGRFSFPNAFLNKAGGYVITFKSPGTDEDSSAPGTPEVDPAVQPTTILFNVKNGPIGDATDCEGLNVYLGTGDFPDPELGPPPVD